MHGEAIHVSHIQPFARFGGVTDVHSRNAYSGGSIGSDAKGLHQQRISYPHAPTIDMAGQIVKENQRVTDRFKNSGGTKLSGIHAKGEVSGKARRGLRAVQQEVGSPQIDSGIAFGVDVQIIVQNSIPTVKRCKIMLLCKQFKSKTGGRLHGIHIN